MRSRHYRILLQREPQGWYGDHIEASGLWRYLGGDDRRYDSDDEGSVELSIKDLYKMGEDIPTEEGLLEYIIDVHA